MKTKLLCTYIISVLSITLASGQENNNNNNEQSKYPQRYGIRVGVDLSKPIRSFMDKDYFGVEIVADYRIKKRLYVAGELGREKKVENTQYFGFKTEGQYVKLGVDYNSYNNWYGMENMIYVGGRYCISNFKHNVNWYKIHTLNNYWEENLSGENNNFLGETDSRFSSWIELVIGMKVELIKNIYAGASVRFNKIVHQSKGDFPNYWMPGFNRVWENSGYGIGYNYTISYMIPLKTK